VESALFMLDASGGDYAIALSLARESAPSAAPAAPSATLEDPPVRAPIPPRREVLLPPEEDPHALAIARSMQFRDFESETRAQEAMMGLSHNSGILGSHETAPARRSGRKTLSELFRPPLDLVFRGSLFAARDEGTKRGLWLLVNIMDYQCFDSQVLNRDVWSNGNVRKLLEGTFLLWQASLDSPHGAKYTHFYPDVRSPYIAALDPTTGCLLDTHRSTDPKALCQFLKQVVSSHGRLPSPDGAATNGTTGAQPSGSGEGRSPQRKRRRSDSPPATTSSKKHRTITETDEEEQMRRAIEESLKSCGQEQEDEEEEEDLFPDNLDDDDDGEVNYSFEDKSSTVAEEKSQSGPTDKIGPDDWLSIVANFDKSDTCSLAIRMPDGTRHTIDVPRAAPVKAIHTYLAGRGCRKGHCQAFFGFPKKDCFKLHSNASLEDCGIAKREMITVQSDE